MSSPPRQRVSPEQIRARFNAEGYLQRVQRGELRQVVRLEKPLSLTTCQAKGYPLGTRKQLIEYYDGESKVALVHLVVLPDGTIGASGLPDPKVLMVEGVLWFV
jgi:hypothetical protein